MAAPFGTDAIGALAYFFAPMKYVTELFGTFVMVVTGWDSNGAAQCACATATKTRDNDKQNTFLLPGISTSVSFVPTDELAKYRTWAIYGTQAADLEGPCTSVHTHL